MNQNETIALFEKCEAARKATREVGKSEGEAHEAAKAVWNGWAEPLLAERNALKEQGKQAAQKNGGNIFNPEDEITKTWMDRAKADFSSVSFVGKDRRAFPVSPNIDRNNLNFSGFVFPGSVSFDGVVFPDAVNFAGAVFEGHVSFNRAAFAGRVWFNRAAFSGKVQFDRAAFSDLAVFRRAVFSDDASFTDAAFSDNAMFEGAAFSGEAWFQCVKFSRDASFERGAFLGRCSFCFVAFSDNAMFEGAAFSVSPNFIGAAFSGDATFDGATFSDGVSFDGAKFSGRASFLSAKFSHVAEFTNTVFSNAAAFGSAEFSFVYFDNAIFKLPSHFPLAKFAKYASFKRVYFQNGCDFQGIDANGLFSLERARFDTVPDFTQAFFKRPPRPDNMKVKGNGTASCFRMLKGFAKDGNDTEREHEFFARELRSARFTEDWPLPRRKVVENDKSRWRWLNSLPIPPYEDDTWAAVGRFWFGWAYDIFGGLGSSMVRPFAWWVATILLATLFYLSQSPNPHTAQDGWTAPRACFEPEAGARVIALPPELASLTSTRSEALQLAVRTSFLLLDASEANTRSFGCLYGMFLGGGQGLGQPLVPPAVSIATSVQKLVSGILIFLFGLALRNLLKIK